MSITAIQAGTEIKMGFSHKDPVLAFSYIKAEAMNMMTAWACMSEAEKRTFVRAEVKRGLYHWQWRDWSIRYFTAPDSLAMYLSDSDPRHPQGDGCCPRCLDDDIEGGSVSIEGRNAIQECYCHSCRFEWRDIYGHADALHLVDTARADDEEDGEDD